MILASVKGFGPGPYEDCKIYENAAQCVGGAASTTGFRDGPPLVTSAQIGDAGAGLHLALGIAAALYQRTRTGRGQKVDCAMQDAVLNLCRVKLRDQQRLARGPLKNIASMAKASRSAILCRARATTPAAASRAACLNARGWETDPKCLYLFHYAGRRMGRRVRRDRRTGMENAPRLRHAQSKAAPAQPDFRADRAMDPDPAPSSRPWKSSTSMASHAVPILSMKELAEEPSLRTTGTAWPGWITQRAGNTSRVGNPIKMSDSPSEVVRSPLLGEHTHEILRDVLGFCEEQIVEIERSGAISEHPRAR